MSNLEETVNKYIELTKRLVDIMSADMKINFDHVDLLDYLAIAGIVISDHSVDGVNYAAIAYSKELYKPLVLNK